MQPLGVPALSSSTESKNDSVRTSMLSGEMLLLEQLMKVFDKTEHNNNRRSRYAKKEHDLEKTHTEYYDCHASKIVNHQLSCGCSKASIFDPMLGHFCRNRNRSRDGSTALSSDWSHL
jgi:hypothetical protein